MLTFRIDQHTMNFNYNRRAKDKGRRTSKVFIVIITRVLDEAIINGVETSFRSGVVIAKMCNKVGETARTATLMNVRCGN